MELYLVRRGDVDPNLGDADGGPPLTEAGLANVRRCATFAARLGVRVAEIRHSEKLRAVQTAQEKNPSMSSKPGERHRTR